MSSVEELVVRRFGKLYGPPTSPDPDGFADEYHKALDGTNPKLLEEAIDEVVKRQIIPAWPTVGACVEAVNQVLERRASERRRQEPKQDDYRQPTPEERARIAKLFADLKGRLAAKRDQRVTLSPEDWSRSSKPAWDERMETSETARQLSLPRNLRRL
jgi:hypothetical protein